MPGQDDLDPHFSRALHDPIKVIHLEPQQDTVSVWLVVAVADRTVMVFYFEAVQLKHQLIVRDQLLVFGAAVIAPAAEQTLIPAAARFHVSYRDQRLGAHAF